MYKKKTKIITTELIIQYTFTYLVQYSIFILQYSPPGATATQPLLMTEEANLITFHDYKIKISQLPSHQPVPLRVTIVHCL